MLYIKKYFFSMLILSKLGTQRKKKEQKKCCYLAAFKFYLIQLNKI